jgi:hypothetical protein
MVQRWSGIDGARWLKKDLREGGKRERVRGKEKKGASF